MVVDSESAKLAPASATPRATGSPKKTDKKEDVLDREDFNVTHYINEMFPTGVVARLPSGCTNMGSRQLKQRQHAQ